MKRSFLLSSLLIAVTSLSFVAACSRTANIAEQTTAPSPNSTPLPVPSYTPEPTQTPTPPLPHFVPSAEEMGQVNRLPPLSEQALAVENKQVDDIDPLISEFIGAAKEHFGNVELTHNAQSGDAFRWNPISRADSGNVLWAYRVIDGKRILQDLPTPISVNRSTGQLYGVDTSFLFFEVPASETARVVYTGSNNEFPVLVKNLVELDSNKQAYSTYFEFNLENGEGSWKWLPDLAEDDVVEVNGQFYRLDELGNMVETTGYWNIAELGEVPSITMANSEHEFGEDGSMTFRFVVEDLNHPQKGEEGMYTVPAYTGEVEGIPAEGLEMAPIAMEDRYLVMQGKLRPQIRLQQDAEDVVYWDWVQEQWLPMVDFENADFLEGQLTDLGILNGQAEINPGSSEMIFREYWEAWGQSQFNQRYIQAVFGHFPVTFEEIQEQETLPIVINRNQQNEMWFPMPYSKRGTLSLIEEIKNYLYELDEAEREQFTIQGVKTNKMGIRVFDRYEMMHSQNGLREAVDGLIGEPKQFGSGHTFASAVNYTKSGIPIMIIGTWTVFTEYPWLRHIMLRGEDGSLEQDLVAATFITWNHFDLMEYWIKDYWWCADIPGERGPCDVDNHPGFYYEEFLDLFGSYLPGEEDFTRIPFRPSDID